MPTPSVWYKRPTPIGSRLSVSGYGGCCRQIGFPFPSQTRRSFGSRQGTRTRRTRFGWAQAPGSSPCTSLATPVAA
eukprot:4475196-Pyramimonas_sp.AAC.1